MTNKITVIAAIWLVIAPFVLNYADGKERYYDIITGIIIGIFTLAKAITAKKTSRPDRINFIFGIWLITAPFLLNYGPAIAKTNNIILGVIITVLALMSIRPVYRQKDKAPLTEE